MKTTGPSPNSADRRREIATRPLPGGRELRLWAHDVRSPEFAVEAKRQADLIAHSEDEKDALRFCEEAMNYWIHEWTYDDGEAR